MKICLITSVYALSENDRNGSFLVESVRYLKRNGHDITIFAPSYEGLGDHCIEGVPVHRFRYFFRKWENLTHGQGAPNRIRNPFYLIVAFFYILLGLIKSVWFCRKEKFDVLHVHWPFPHGIWGYAAGKLSGTPVVLNFHGAELLLAEKFFFVNYFLRHSLKHASGIICNSSYTAKKVSALTDKHVDVIPFGTTLEVKSVAKNKSKPRKDILFAGRLIARKGLEYLLQAMPIIDESVPAHLHVVGDGNMAETWRKLSHDMGLDEMVTFHGFVSNEELIELYAGADLFVLPAIVDDRGDTEGLGVVLVEALCFKTPVVASDVGGISDVIINKQTGLLVPEKDVPALSNACIKVLKDDELASHLVDQGLAHAQSYFDWQRITSLIEKVYERL